MDAVQEPTAPQARPPSPPMLRIALKRWRAAIGPWTLPVAIVLLAFSLAAFPARNTDLFRHLAAGRLACTGHYQIGVDPFTHVAGDTYWVNHNWLLDMATYLLYEQFGGWILVGVKALLVALL